MSFNILYQGALEEKEVSSRCSEMKDISMVPVEYLE